MPYYGSVQVFYTENGQPIDELPDGPAFDKIILDGLIDEHVAMYLDENFPEVDHGSMQYEVEQGGDSIIGFEYTGEVPPPEIQIPPFTYEFVVGPVIYVAEFSPLKFRQVAGGKRRGSRRSKRRATYKKRKSASRRNARKSRRVSKSYRKRR